MHIKGVKGMKPKYSVVLLLSILTVFIFVNYQNCSSGGNNLALPSSGNMSSSACNLQISDSSGIPQTTFQVGQIANVNINTPAGSAIFIMTYNQAVVQNQSISTPTTLQQNFTSPASVGTYTISIQAAQNGKVICNASTSFSVVPQGSTNITTCILSATSSINAAIGQAVPFSITSSPTGLQAFVSGDGLVGRVPKGMTNVNYNETFSSAGSFARHADVQDNTGAYIPCTNNIAISVSGKW